MERIKSIWNNRKTRGIVFLILYVVLFSYIFTIYGGKSGKVILPDNKPSKVVKEKDINYEYEYITNEEKILITKYKNILSFKKDNIDYYYIDGEYYSLKESKLYKVESPIKYNFDYLNKIDDLKNISTLVKTSKYANGEDEENYNINMAQFFELLGLKEEADAKKMINYSIVSVNNTIIEIDFDTIEFKIRYTKLKDIAEIKIDYEFGSEGEE